MEQKQQLFTNTAMSVLQTVVMGITPFILYRYLIQTLGAEQLGLWSLVLSTTSLARVGELGLSASVVKFVAKYVARDEQETASDVIQTAAISIGAGLSLLLLLAYPFAGFVLSWVVPSQQLNLALSILPYSLASLLITTVTAVFQSGFDGYQRIDLRSIIMMFGSIIYLLLCFALTPKYGIWGLAYSQVLQSGIVLIVSWELLRRVFRDIPIIPYRWKSPLFHEMISYGVNFQVISIAQMFYHPVTTALLSRFGGLAVVGYYEMARRMIRQFRSLIISANQVIIPFIADLHEKAPDNVQVVYKNSYRLLFFLSLPLYGLTMALTPIISEVWIGHYEPTFVYFSILLAIGWFLNTLNAPAYFANLGLGELRWNTISGLTTAVLNGLLGLIFGSLFGGTAVVITWVFSLIIGSWIVIVTYHRKHKLAISSLLPKESQIVTLTNVLGVFVALFVYYRFLITTTLFTRASVVILLYVSIVILPIWSHPMRKQLIRWTLNYLLKGRLLQEAYSTK